jgi:hypothetical protein
LNQNKLKESLKQEEYKLYLNFIKKFNNEDLQNEDLRIFFMFHLIFEKSQIIINSLNFEPSDIYLQKIQKLQSDLTNLNEKNVRKISNNLQDFHKNNKIFYELLKNIDDNKPKLKHIFNKDSDDSDFDDIHIYDKDYKSSDNRLILSLINKFEESESSLINNSIILNEKKEVFIEIQTVIWFCLKINNNLLRLLIQI